MKKEVRAVKAQISIKVESIAESVECYRKMFGIEPTKVRTGDADPDGNEWEICVVLKENLPETIQSPTCCVIPTDEKVHISSLCSVSTN